MRHILLICNVFFDYYKDIITEFESLGYKVDHYNDRPYKNSILVGMQKISRKLMTPFIEHYFNYLFISTRNNNYDYVIFINNNSLSYAQIEKLRIKHKNAKFILYLWDSIKNYPHLKLVLELFDKVFSFDPQDCKNHLYFFHLPLFYSKDFIVENNYISEQKFKLSSVFTAHPNRYQLFLKFKKNLDLFNFKSYFYPYLNFLQFLYYVVRDKRIKFKYIFKLKFSRIKRIDYINLLKVSEIIFDVPHEGQSGLTIRVFETLGSKKKLITTNSEIINYDFYNKNNIFVLTSDYKSSDLLNFLNAPYHEINLDIYKKYSINNWVIQLLK
jgi:hypothetical protein